MNTEWSSFYFCWNPFACEQRLYVFISISGSDSIYLFVAFFFDKWKESTADDWYKKSHELKEETNWIEQKPITIERGKNCDCFCVSTVVVLVHSENPFRIGIWHHQILCIIINVDVKMIYFHHIRRRKSLCTRFICQFSFETHNIWYLQLTWHTKGVKFRLPLSLSLGDTSNEYRRAPLHR